MRPGRAARITGALLLTAPFPALILALTAPGTPAFAAPPCPAGLSPAPAQQIGATPWPQDRYDLDRLDGIADGAGVVVAVLDSGVAAGQPNLDGRVLPGADLLAAGGDGGQDCVGHGTAVASIIAARPVAGAPLRGVAPGAEILPVRVTERTAANQTGVRDAPADGLATAIRLAVDRGAGVLNISITVAASPALASAVAYAVAHDVVVVAAAGNQHRSDGGADPVPYPAAYPGVVGVGAIGPDGQRLAESQVGGYVKLAAPGGSVIGAAQPRGLATFAGTSFAVPFVAGAAALVRQRYPQLSAAGVAQRLYATADPAPDGAPSTSYGYGVVDPYRAATAAGGGPAVPGAVAAVAGPRRPAGTGGRPDLSGALPLAAGGVLLAGILLVLGRVAGRAAARHWRPGN